MMVIQGQLAAANGTIAANTTYLFPADRCAWTQTSNSNGSYNVATASFISSTGTPVTINDPVLGYIGKSGRFVEIAG